MQAVPPAASELQRQEIQTSMMQVQLEKKLAGLCDLMATSNHVDPTKLPSFPAVSVRKPLTDRTNEAAPGIEKQPGLKRQNEVKNFSPWHSESEQSRRWVENIKKADLCVAARRLRDTRARSWDSGTFAASYSSLGSSNCYSQRWRKTGSGEPCPGNTRWRCGSSKTVKSSDLQRADSATSVATTRIWEPWDGSNLVTEDSGIQTVAGLRRDRLREGAVRPSPRTAHGVFAASLREFSQEDRSQCWERSPSWDSTMGIRRTESETRQHNARERSRQSSLDRRHADAVLQAVCCAGKKAEDARTTRRYMELQAYNADQRTDHSSEYGSCRSSTASLTTITGLQSSRASLGFNSSLNSARQTSTHSIPEIMPQAGRDGCQKGLPKIASSQDASRMRSRSESARSLQRTQTDPVPKQITSARSASREPKLSVDSRGRKQVSAHRSPSMRSASSRGISPWFSPRTSLPRSERPSSRQGTPLGALKRNGSARRLVPWAQSECRREITRLRDELHRAAERLCVNSSLGLSETPGASLVYSDDMTSNR